MKTLFLSLNKNYILDSAGSNVVFKYDLLNDILYELGAELAFMTKDDSIGDKAKIITDVKDARPEAFDEIVDKIKTLVVGKLLMPEIPEETTIPLPETYVDWLAYNSNLSYAEIGKKVRKAGNKVTLCLTDIYDEYITGKVLPRVRDIIVANDEINKFAIVGHNDSESKFVKTIIDMRSGLDFEPFDGPWLQYEIGYALGNGVGTAKNLEEAFKHYLASAEKRNPLAANWVGWCYQQGLGTKSDLSKALVWYNVGAELKSHAAEANAAYFYENGMGTEVNINKAAELYERALSDNNNIAFALNNLANIYYNGKLGEPNYEKAFHFYERGASTEGVMPNCAYMVGYMLYNGQGVEKNDKEALAYLERASKNGVQAAHYLAGKLHAEGAGTDFGTEDLVKAKTAYQRGRDAGDDKCALELARIYIKEGSSSVSDIIDNFKFANDKNNNDAAFELAKFLHDNKGAGENLGDSYSPVALLAKLTAANYPEAEELRVQYQKEIDDENARIEQEKREQEEAEQERIRLENEKKEREDNAAHLAESVLEAVKTYQEEVTSLSNRECVKMFLLGARKGIPVARACLGWIIANNDSVIRCEDQQKLADLILSSIEPGDSELLENIKGYNDRNIHTTKVYTFYWSKGICPICYAIIGACYFYGAVLPKDEKKGLHYLRTSIGEKPDEFQVYVGEECGLGYFILGNLYRTGHGVAKDLKRAEEYYDKAYSLNGIPMAPAQKALAQRNRCGELPTMRSFPELMIIGAKKHDPVACLNYARLISGQNKGLAEDWINKAVKYSGGDVKTLENARKLMDQIGGTLEDYVPEEPFNIYFERDGRPTLIKPRYISATKEEVTKISESEQTSTPQVKKAAPESKTTSIPEVEKPVTSPTNSTSTPERVTTKTETTHKEVSSEVGDFKSALNMMQGALKDSLRKTVEDIKEATSEATEKKGGLFGRLFGKKK